MKEKWFFAFLMHIEGENSLNEPVEFDEDIKIQLTAGTEARALSQSELYIKKIESCSLADLKKEYCERIDEEGSVSFKNFRIEYQRDLTTAKINQKHGM